MADRKITDLTALTTPASADVLPIVDVSEAAAADKNKKVTVGELFKGIPDGTAAAPAIAFESDDGNGFFLSTTDTIGIATNGVSRATVSTTAVTSTLPISATAFSPTSATVPTNGVYLPATNSVGIATNGSVALTIDSSQRLGVGTTSPNALIQASGGSAPIVRVTDTRNTVNLDLQPANTEAYFGTQSNHPLAFQTNATERLRITSAGLVGIGTSSPASTLHSVGTTILGTGTYPTGSIGLSDARTAILSSTENQILIIGNTNATVGADKGAEIYLGAKATTGSENLAFAKIGGYKSNATSGNFESHLAFSTSNSVGTSSEKVRIDSSGRVGIGTASPGYTLDLNGTCRITNGTNPYIALFNGSNTGYVQVASGNLDVIAPSSGNITFNAGGERARIDTSGRLLVGTSSSSHPAKFITQGNASGGNFASMAIAFNSAASAVSAGTTLGEIDFTDQSAGGVFARIRCAGDGTGGTNDYPGRLEFFVTADGASSPTEYMRIDNAGNLMVRTTTYGTTNTEGFNVTYASGETYSTWGHKTGTAAGQPWCVFSYNGGAIGSITQNGTTGASYNTTSDYRLKENVIAVNDGITRLQQLKPSRFNFISDPGRTVDGFLAHEVQAVVPEAIHGEKDAVDDDGNPQYQGIDQSKLVPLLTAALQEAIGRIESLEAEVAALKAS